jgi:hypothetical protein
MLQHGAQSGAHEPPAKLFLECALLPLLLPLLLLLQIVCRTDVGLGEAYMSGDYLVDDLGGFMALMVRCPAVQGAVQAWWGRGCVLRQGRVALALQTLRASVGAGSAETSALLRVAIMSHVHARELASFKKRVVCRTGGFFWTMRS